MWVHVLVSTGGTWAAFANSTLKVATPAGITTNAATVLLDGAGSAFFDGSSGSTDLQSSLAANAAVGFHPQMDGTLKPGPRVAAEKVVMPMAVSPDKRFLIAAVRSKPYQAYTYALDKASGAL